MSLRDLDGDRVLAIDKEERKKLIMEHIGAVKKKDIAKGSKAMKKAGVGGTVRTSDGKTRRSIPKKEK